MFSSFSPYPSPQWSCPTPLSTFPLDMPEILDAVYKDVLMCLTTSQMFAYLIAHRRQNINAENEVFQHLTSNFSEDYAHLFIRKYRDFIHSLTLYTMNQSAVVAPTMDSSTLDSCSVPMNPPAVLESEDSFPKHFPSPVLNPTPQTHEPDPSLNSLGIEQELQDKMQDNINAEMFNLPDSPIEVLPGQIDKLFEAKGSNLCATRLSTISKKGQRWKCYACDLSYKHLDGVAKHFKIKHKRQVYDIRKTKEASI